MSRRTGISEAPDVVLGEPGREQLVPVLEVLPEQQKNPGKTSVAAMAAYFQGGGGAIQPQIQRLFYNQTYAVNIHYRSNTSPQAVTVIPPPVFAPITYPPLTGEQGFYTTSGRNIDVIESGVYRLTLHLPGGISLGGPTIPDPEDPFIRSEGMSIAAAIGRGADRITTAGNSFTSLVYTDSPELNLVEGSVIVPITAGQPIDITWRMYLEYTGLRISEDVRITIGQGEFVLQPALTIERLSE